MTRPLRKHVKRRINAEVARATAHLAPMVARIEAKLRATSQTRAEYMGRLAKLRADEITSERALRDRLAERYGLAEARPSRPLSPRWRVVGR